MEQTANRLWTLLLRGFGAGRRHRKLAMVGKRFARLVYWRHLRGFWGTCGKLETGHRRSLPRAVAQGRKSPLFSDQAARGAEASARGTAGRAYYAVARVVPRGSEDDVAALGRAAWEEVRAEKFETFAVRAKRSDKSFPQSSVEIDVSVGQYLVDQLRAAGRDARVKLNDPELTCRIEIPPGQSLLVYARKIPGAGGLPPNTAGRMTCLLSGGFDSAVAAHKMMKRGAHLNFVHFWGGGALPGESSVHVARELVKRLVPWQFSAKLYLVPFEPVQREIVARAPEEFRILLYRRMMLRIAERIARSNRALGLITGDSLAQVASQTLHNMAAVGAAVRMPLYRPLAGDDKIEIMNAARKIGTHDISAEPFHDCCPIFLPRNPALHASVEELDQAESTLDIEALVRQGIDGMAIERYRYAGGRVEKVESFKSATA